MTTVTTDRKCFGRNTDPFYPDAFQSYKTATLVLNSRGLPCTDPTPLFACSTSQPPITKMLSLSGTDGITLKLA